CSLLPFASSAGLGQSYEFAVLHGVTKSTGPGTIAAGAADRIECFPGSEREVPVMIGSRGSLLRVFAVAVGGVASAQMAQLVSVSTTGIEGNGGSYPPSLSADGVFATFKSYANNLVPGDTNGWVDVFVRNCKNNTTERVSVDSNGVQANGDSDHPSISADGR